MVNILNYDYYVQIPDLDFTGTGHIGHILTLKKDVTIKIKIEY